MKLTYEQKAKAFKECEKGLKSPRAIARELQVNHSIVDYFLNLAKKHGIEILAHGNNKYYSSDEKLRIINRVLISKESINSVSIDEGLSNGGMLHSWLNSYKENGYNIVERKRGCIPNGKKENGSRTSSGNQRIEGEELETRNRESIYIKIERLNSGKRRARKQEIAQAVSELRQELNCSLKFILDAINTNPSLPHISKSDYYYQISKNDEDLKNDTIMNRIIDIYYNHKGRYGYRRITLQLKNEGYTVNHKAVKRLMTRMGLY